MADEKPSVSGQHARFLETARALGCDEDEAAFDETLKGVVKKPAPAEKQPAKPE